MGPGGCPLVSLILLLPIRAHAVRHCQLPSHSLRSEIMVLYMLPKCFLVCCRAERGCPASPPSPPSRTQLGERGGCRERERRQETSLGCPHPLSEKEGLGLSSSSRPHSLGDLGTYFIPIKDGRRKGTWQGGWKNRGEEREREKEEEERREEE